MSPIPKSSVAPVLRTRIAVALLAAFPLLCVAATAQTLAGQYGSQASYIREASLILPDAPDPVRDDSSSNRDNSSSNDVPSERTSLSDSADPNAHSVIVATPPEASHTEKYIEPGQTVPKLTAKDKAVLGLRDAFSPLAAVGWLVSAGYEQILNGSPNYGTDRGAFGQRLGAAALRASTEGAFSDSILSPIMHEDPRYYQLGPAHNFFVRLVYAGTRPILTRTDGGRTTPNLALLSGTLAGSALASTYYPPVNRGATQTMKTFGGSLGSSAIGDVISEFSADLLHLFHQRHP